MEPTQSKTSSSEYEPSPVHGVSRTTFIVGVSSTLNDTANHMVHPIVPIFLTNVLGASPIVVGIIEGAAGVVSSLFTLLAGVWSDRTGRRAPFVVGGYLLSAVSRTLMFVAFSWWFVLVLRILDRFGRAVRSAARDALIADSVPKNLLGRNFGFYNSADNLGSLVGPLIASGLLVLFNEEIRLVFAFAIIPSLLTVFLLLRIKDKPASAPIPVKKISFAHYRELPRPFYFVLLVNILFALGNSSDAFIILRAQQLGVPVAMIPIAGALVSLVAFAVAYPAGILVDRIGPAKNVTMALVFYIITYLGFAYVHLIGTIAIWPLLLIYGGVGVIAGAFKTLIMSSVPKDRRATAIGIIVTFSGIAALVGNLLAGAMWSLYGSTATFLLGAAFTAVALVVLLLARSAKIF
ncbi:MFS transporter [Meiothermus taiwanensis]|uniref:Inner membrane transport protein YajR n=2 Tax=Meiothermus taiwanensis TaxID=172827 RepID=A0A399E516_9DEIN|nr:MFS transporter [Meiothermus taiwanensis]AWR86808.1 major facilitator superfamily protein [Meiothermus taiwanensis WR-220]RIH79018.1 Inner membrane transport protein YajR [Meiothermus taiwanensis]